MKAGTLAKVSQGSGRWAPNMDGGQPMLKLRPSGLSSPAYRDWIDHVIVEDSRDVGRIYEDRSLWFWSITVYLNPKRGITTSGRASSLEEAKAQFLANWQKCCTDSTAAAQRPT